MEITITYSQLAPPPPTGYVLPVGMGPFWRHRRDEEIPPDYKVRDSAYNHNGGTPLTRTSYEGLFVKMDEARQEWHWDVVWRNAASKEWRDEYDSVRPQKRIDTMLGKKSNGFCHSALAWFNHNHGSDVRAVYPLYQNLTKADGSPNSPIAQQMLGSGGIVRQIGDVFSKNGVEYVPCQAMRPSDTPTWSELLQTPWLMNVATVQRSVEVYNGYHYVNPFDHLTAGGIVYDSPLILLSDTGVITFRKDALEPVAEGSPLPSPYWPPRPFGPALASWNS